MRVTELLVGVLSAWSATQVLRQRSFACIVSRFSFENEHLHLRHVAGRTHGTDRMTQGFC